MNDQIKLAKLMGWQHIPRTIVDAKPCGYWKEAHWRHPNGKEINNADFPDPFTDANDDYAVLRWMRPLNGRMPAHMADNRKWRQFIRLIDEPYILGNWAKAALRVISDE